MCYKCKLGNDDKNRKKLLVEKIEAIRKATDDLVVQIIELKKDGVDINSKEMKAILDEKRTSLYGSMEQIASFIDRIEDKDHDAYSNGKRKNIRKALGYTYP